MTGIGHRDAGVLSTVIELPQSEKPSSYPRSANNSGISLVATCFPATERSARTGLALRNAVATAMPIAAPIDCMTPSMPALMPCCSAGTPSTMRFGVEA
ncbi:hypothetical protein C5E45_26100 [Nocardia nova]|uniref:Uncharacterized protein n=1 Tax=Nocardia nova TaxID=37330 RepID=A0A2S6AJG3_9NOCA|nr:hypothetical protein [Nocardia nova]PPJ22598.1 hypothetical protein C5E41_26765 [Nocardia nova]PPJ35337.1 hypothetical protein C5E45_26100 [Nocardia nova]